MKNKSIADPALPNRLASIDAYRGIVMFLMMAEVLRFGKIPEKYKDNWLWNFLAEQQSHVEWVGCSLHDLIQPSFSFLVGTALAFSLMNRQAKGQSTKGLILHAIWRSILLILLGVFLRSVGRPQTNWTFEDTLTQIGLGYLPLVLIALAKPLWHWIAVAILLFGYWSLFAVYPAPTPEFFEQNKVIVESNWVHPAGFASHWDKNSNAAWAFDQWFLNLFPRERTFEFNRGGYATLSFIPTLATMLLGLIAGGWIKKGINLQVLGVLGFMGVVSLTLGYALDRFGICPNVKRIWTPSWTLFSGGWCFLLLAFFALTTDFSGRSGWSFPFKVIGANSIVAYVGSHLIEGFVISSFQTHFGKEIFLKFGTDFQYILTGIIVLCVYWLVLWWMYAKRIFVKI